MHIHISHHRFCFHWAKIDKTGTTDYSPICCQGPHRKDQVPRRKKLAMFGISYGMAHSIRARHGSGAQSVESLSFLQAPRKNSSGSLSEMPCDFRTSVLNGNCKEPLGSPIAFRDSINNGSGMESIVSPHHQFSSRDVVKPSSTQTPPEYTKDVAPAELPDRSPDQSMSTTDHVSSNFLQSPSSSLQSTWNSNNYTLALLNIQEADSTSIKELPCFNSERINSKIPYNTKKRDGISKFGRRLSHQLSINTSMELIPIDVASRNQNLSGPVYFQPVSSNFSSHQTFESVQSMRPPTQEDVHQFENRCFDSTQHESALLATSLRRSSQTTISSDTLPTDSGYESASLRPCDSSIASPGSLTFGFEQIGLDDSFPYTDAQFMGLSGSSQGDNFNQGMSLRQQSMQMHNPGDEETLGLPAAHFDLPLQMQGIEAQSFIVDRANQFEPNDAIYSPTSWFDARITQDFTDMDEASLNENMLADLEPQPQPLQSLSHLKDIDPFNRGMSTAGHFSNDSCAPHTHTHNSQLDWGLNSIQTHENEQIYSPPWSAESVR